MLFDLKCNDPTLHLEFTGVSNKQILENLVYLRDYRNTQHKPFDLWIRTALIPGATASDENIQALGYFLADALNGSVSRWELCAFNNLCSDQYKRLGMEWTYAHTPLMTAEELARCEKIAKASGFRPDLILATGATRAVELL